MLALDRSIPPGLDGCIDLLQVQHRRGRDPGAPQGLRDVLDPTHRDPRQIHRQPYLNVGKTLYVIPIPAPAASLSSGASQEWPEADSHSAIEEEGPS
jgi:hypothetical protein